jgi:integrase
VAGSSGVLCFFLERRTFMSVYSVKGKGWRYDFTLKGERHTEAWFKTKREAQNAEAKRREELKNPRTVAETQTDITFLDLVNLRLDFIQEYKTRSYYDDNRYMLKRLVKVWGELTAREITTQMIQQHLLARARESHYAANYDLRLLKALFNHGVRNKVLKENPVLGVPFLPVEKKVKYVPPVEDIDKVISEAGQGTQDYLWTIRETMARVSEINRLTWDDVDFKSRTVTLYTRKKKGGHLTPRKVPMSVKLREILERRFTEKDPEKPWVFWHTYWSAQAGEWKDGPYQDRKLLMRGLCKKAGVRYFRYHALRHAGASIMDSMNVPISAIQSILGHENRTTTEIYLHSIGDAERIAIAAYEQGRNGGDSHTKSHTKAKGATSHPRNPLNLLVGR